MRIFAAIVSRSPLSQVDVERLLAVGDRSQPAYWGAPRCRHWISADRRSVVFVWADDGDAPYGESAGSVGVFSGLLHREGRPLTQDECIALAREGIDLGSDLGGAAAGVILANGELLAWNMLARLENVYWSRSEDRLVVANRPLLAHRLARGKPEQEYSKGFLLVNLQAGYPATEGTPFAGVETLPPASKLRWNGREAVMDRGEWPEPVSHDDLTDDLLHALVASVGPVTRARQRIRSGLTGGKDSRLIAALLKASGADFEAYTSGLDDHPDVIVAKRVARTLGIQHQTGIGLLESSEVTALEWDVLGESLHRLRLTDGSHSVYESIGGSGKVQRRHGVFLGGQGGEVLRGGFAKRMTDAHPAVRARLLQHVTRYAEYFPTAQRKTSTIETTAWWMANTWRPDPRVALWRYYTAIRSGRWAAAAWSAISITARPVWPFYDNQVIRLAARAPMDDLVSERTMFKVIARLEPSLAVIPLAEAKWRFEDVDGALAPTSVQATTARSKFNPKFVFSTGLADLMRDHVIEAVRGSVLSELVTEEEARRMLDDASRGVYDGRKGPSVALWSLFSVSLLVSDVWLEEHLGEGVVRIPVPPLR